MTLDRVAITSCFPSALLHFLVLHFISEFLAQVLVCEFKMYRGPLSRSSNSPSSSNSDNNPKAEENWTPENPKIHTQYRSLSSSQQMICLPLFVLHSPQSIVELLFDPSWQFTKALDRAKTNHLLGRKRYQ